MSPLPSSGKCPGQKDCLGRRFGALRGWNHPWVPSSGAWQALGLEVEACRVLVAAGGRGGRRGSEARHQVSAIALVLAEGSGLAGHAQRTLARARRNGDCGPLMSGRWSCVEACWVLLSNCDTLPPLSEW